MSEIIFVIEDAAEGGFVARALGASIVTEADTLDGLRAAIRDAVQCHFDDAERPKVAPAASNASATTEPVFPVTPVTTYMLPSPALRIRAA